MSDKLYLIPYTYKTGLMVEVTPDYIQVNSNIGQVVLKRLISAEEVLDILTRSEIVSKK